MTTMTADQSMTVAARRRAPGLVFYGLIVMTVIFFPALVAMAIMLLRTQ